MKKGFVFAAILVLIPFIGCSDEGVDTSEIQKATTTQVEAISLGLEQGFSLSNAYTQKLKTDEYAFCAQLKGAGIDDIEVWFFRERDGLPVTVYSASSSARSFSEWPYHPDFIPSSVESNLTRYVKQLAR